MNELKTLKYTRKSYDNSRVNKLNKINKKEVIVNVKIKYLFNNKDLVHMLLNNWEHDNEDFNSLNYYRISSNAVYWCKNKGNTFFLDLYLLKKNLRKASLLNLIFKIF